MIDISCQTEWRWRRFIHNWAKVVLKFHLDIYFQKTFTCPRLQFQKISWNHWKVLRCRYWIHKQTLTPMYFWSVGDLWKLNKSCQVLMTLLFEPGPLINSEQLNQTRSRVLKTFTKQTSFDWQIGLKRIQMTGYNQIWL